MKHLPANLALHKRTKVFTAETLPDAMQTEHRTADGTWGKINVLKGELEYAILGQSPEWHLLRPEKPGVIEPDTPHRVAPQGEVEFFVEFYK